MFISDNLTAPVKISGEPIANLIASTSGISGVIRSDGSVEHKSGQFVSDVYVASVGLRDGHTLATTLGDWPQWVLTGLGIIGAVLALLARRRRRVVPPVPTPGPARERVHT